MLKIIRWTLAIVLAFAACTKTNGQNQKPISELELQSILNEYNRNATAMSRTLTEALWDVETDVGNQVKVNKKVMYRFIHRFC